MNSDTRPADPARRLAEAAARSVGRGAFQEARRLLEQAVQAEPNSPGLWLNFAACLRACGDSDSSLAAIEQVLRLAPRAFAALLMKGSLLERKGDMPAAVSAYGAALGLAPPQDQLDFATRQALDRAREVHGRYVADLRLHILKELGAPTSGANPERLRIELFIDATLGYRRVYRQEPTDFFYPELPAIEFYPREEFPWLSKVESATPKILEELRATLAGDVGFTPYVDYPDSVPLDQWLELNHSPRWSAYHFFHFGQRYEENCQRCPRTLEALAVVPQPKVPGRMPAAMYSVLKAGTRIPPHTGVANVRLVAHLPLIVPPDCGFRVGNQTRAWRPGEAWVFDDTIEHEAWNLSDRDRVILIFDVWNPRLGQAELDAIAAIMVAMDRFKGHRGSSDL